MRLRSPELLSALSQMCDFAIPFQKHLGFKLIGFDPARIRFDHRADLVGHPVYGRLHGGVISTALDSVGGMAMMLAIADRHPEEPIKDIVSKRFARLGTIDMRTDFLRPGLGKYFVASAEVTRLGGRVGTCQMELRNEEDLLIATGAASYILT